MDPQLYCRVSQLGKDELLELNRWVVERLREIIAVETRRAAERFGIGDEVEFRASCGHRVRGHVVRINRKTITVENEDTVWRVSPNLLQPAPTGVLRQADELCSVH